MKEIQKVLDIFCTRCQEVTEHVASLDHNGEYLFHCTAKSVEDPKNPNATVYHHFLKLPADFPTEKMEEYFATHMEHNQGQVIVEEQEKKLASVLDNLGHAPAEKPADTDPAPAGDTTPAETQATADTTAAPADTSATPAE